MRHIGIIDHVVKLWSKFPGIGEKSARRMVFYLLRQDKQKIREFASALSELADNIHHCSVCGAITDTDPCYVCSDQMRDRSVICVVETEEDCAAIEQSGVFGGLYHVLGGHVSPLDDEVIPEESLERLHKRVSDGVVKEVILATSPKIEGDLTAFTVQEVLSDCPVKITRPSYGLPAGGSIGFADRMTLHMALDARKELKSSI